MISVRLADLAEARETAVLRPVTAEWTATNSTTRRLETVAGPQVEAQCRSLGELPVGSAVVTGAGRLPAEYLIHAVVRSVEQPVSPGGVQRALRNGLRRVAEWGFASLALPPLGTGAGNLDAEESAEVMVPILVEYLRTAERSARIAILVESEYERDAFELALRRNGFTAVPPSANQNQDAGSA
jgi:O-acetyl-ADP-ribose deacetylase (regulator of RNase III)